MDCIYCGSNKFHRFESFPKFRTVTSDRRPWQSGFEIGLCEDCGFPQTCVTEDWKISASKIYRKYDANNANQNISSDKGAVNQGLYQNRVDRLARFAVREVSPKRGGNILDFGCGNGNLLRFVSGLRSDLNLFGFDLDDKQLENLHDIENFRHLIVGDLNTNLKFDLIFMSHTLEHLTNPLEILHQLRDLLNSDGHLVVAVPDCANDPFKLLVADHCSHFSSKTLENLLLNVGFKVVYIDDMIETRECWAICKSNENTSYEVLIAEDAIWLGESIKWLELVKSDVADLATRESFGIFGTSMNAIWLYGEFVSKVEFFVDEDVSRQGTMLFDLPVLSPAQVIDGSTVYLPFVPTLANKIVKRLSRPGVTWVVPRPDTEFRKFSD
jgi:2-polyprenyl-3-methyl-5-hydroxy-6-metoxy-1,4-benzoquinol methylase